MILLALVALSSLSITETTNKEAETFADQITTGISQTPSYIKQAGHYLLSIKGAQDLVLAYLLGMSLTAIHELGHAIIAKILCGAPIQLTLGASPRSNQSYVQMGGITLGGFNPTTGYASIGYNPSAGSPLKEAAIYAAGPVFGALSSLGAYLLLRNYDELYIAKAAALFGLFNHTLGIAGIGGTWIPGTDAYRLLDSLKRYRDE